MTPFYLLELPVVGAGTHHGGWPAALQALRKRTDDSGVLLDDYIERTFLFSNHDHLALEHRRPWVGIFHHPPGLPAWYSTEALERLQDVERWNRSREHLLGLIALAPYAADWARNAFGCPAISVVHPTISPKLRWDPIAFLGSKRKCVVQVGTFLRNLNSIHNLAVPNDFRKIRIRQLGDWVIRAEAVCAQQFGSVDADFSVETVPPLPPMQYEDLLSRSIVFLDLIASVANNSLVECIVRRTPVLVNRTNGAEDYLGRGYPLFFSDLDEAKSLLNTECVLAAHDYLCQLDCEMLSTETFADSVVNAIQRFAINA